MKRWMIGGGIAIAVAGIGIAAAAMTGHKACQARQVVYGTGVVLDRSACDGASAYQAPITQNLPRVVTSQSTTRAPSAPSGGGYTAPGYPSTNTTTTTSSNTKPSSKPKPKPTSSPKPPSPSPSPSPSQSSGLPSIPPIPTLP